MKAHEYANLFPMMTNVELEALAEDIKANGLRHPIVTYKGEVLDGRNRLRACDKAGVKPTFTEYDGDDAGALALVESLNIERRDLTSAQRAIVAARRWGLNGYSKGGRPSKEKPLQTATVSVQSLARKYKVSNNTISQARDLLSEAPDLAEQVEACAISLAAAYQQLQQRQAEEARKQREAAQKARDAEKVTEFKDAISNGEITLDEALRLALEQKHEEEQTRAAQADARATWLRSFEEHLRWFEIFLNERTDEHLAWYTLPGSPGLINHGITAERVQDVIDKLTRARDITFKG